MYWDYSSSTIPEQPDKSHVFNKYPSHPNTSIKSAAALESIEMYWEQEKVIHCYLFGLKPPSGTSFAKANRLLILEDSFGVLFPSRLKKGLSLSPDSFRFPLLLNKLYSTQIWE
jgi:hypothetical protein